jgi:hypothetical protein
LLSPKNATLDVDYFTLLYNNTINNVRRQSIAAECADPDDEELA